MSSTEMPYSWNSARAIRWRTCSLGVSFSSARAGDEVEDPSVLHDIDIVAVGAG